MTDLMGQLEPRQGFNTLTQHAYDQIKRALIAGAFEPGQKLTVRSAAAALNISQTPAREAIGRLVAEGGLDAGTTRSFSVPSIGKTEFDEIYELRILLEGLASFYAAPRFDSAKLLVLETCQAALVAARKKKDYKEMLRQNEIFHFTIYQSSEHKLLVNFIEGLWLRTGPLLNKLYPDYTLNVENAQFHLDALQAIRERDAEALRSAMQNDVRAGGAFLRQLV